uniref:Uncharacterized protein n=1 Tax=Physcomitrium patens TaxID=3218 RepID=A0A2K1KJB8_PHYPA|nr:hypothetical protein PHYPA_007538 [Physcomitrium patens]
MFLKTSSTCFSVIFGTMEVRGSVDSEGPAPSVPLVLVFHLDFFVHEEIVEVVCLLVLGEDGDLPESDEHGLKGVSSTFSLSNERYQKKKEDIGFEFFLTVFEESNYSPSASIQALASFESRPFVFCVRHVHPHVVLLRPLTSFIVVRFRSEEVATRLSSLAHSSPAAAPKM